MKINEGKWLDTVINIEDEGFPAISLKVVMSENNLINLETEWNKTVKESSGTIYQTFEWLYYWWKHFGKGKHHVLYVILIYFTGNRENYLHDKKLIGIAPFFIQSYSLAGFRIYRQLKLIGCGLNSAQSISNAVDVEGLSDYLDIISIKGYESIVAKTLTLYLIQFGNFFDEISLENISNDSFIFNNLLPLLQENELDIEICESNICPALSVPVSFECFIDSVKPGTRRKVKQSIKQLSDNSLCKIEDVNFQQYDSSIEILRRLHQKRWNELGYPGLFSDDRTIRFLNDVNRALLRKGLLWFKILKLDKKVIAARLAYNFNNRMYDYLSGFDNISSSAALRPGFILIVSMIKNAIEQSSQFVDFLRGAEEYKFEISTTINYNYKAVIKNSNNLTKLKVTVFGLLQLKRKLLQRIRNEKSIISVHISRYGLSGSLKPYLKFFGKRIKTLLNRKNDITYRKKKIIKIINRDKNEEDNTGGKPNKNKIKNNLYEPEIKL